MSVKKSLFYFLILILTSCSQIEKAKDKIIGLSEKEQYQKDREISDELFRFWQDQAEIGLRDSVAVELPYSEIGRLQPRSFAVYSYETYLLPGEIIEAQFETDSSQVLIFSDIYRQNKEEVSGFHKLASGKASEKNIQFESRQAGLYKVIFQPEIEANTPFRIHISKSPAYLFPVMGGRNADIGSYFGDIRDGGKRNHKGVDIFAKKGTPVLAAVSGNIGYTGEKGLGGKQVWLRDPKRRQSLYYAHLDSIKPGIDRVNPGDTLGFVGNTGNARTTPSHLHFGIYTQQGAIDPIGYVYLQEEADNIASSEKIMPARLSISARKAVLRNKPATSNSEILRNAEAGEFLSVQGKSADWFHVRDSLHRSAFIHESLVTPMN
ncbi:MAG: M23 family metallopeptidase [Christiangramia sp.]|nr:peptidase M23 [Christiangramia sp.]